MMKRTPLLHTILTALTLVFSATCAPSSGEVPVEQPPDAGFVEDTDAATDAGLDTASNVGEDADASRVATWVDLTRRGEVTRHTLETADGPRTFDVYLPADYGNTSAYALVFVFHGGNGSSMAESEQDLITSWEWSKKADEEGAIVVAPRALGGNWADGRGETQSESTPRVSPTARFSSTCSPASSQASSQPSPLSPG